MTKKPESNVVIRFPDCDPFNHLNNARYIDYFMNAREDHLLDNYQFDLYGHIHQTGKGWMVTKNKISHLRPANLKETVIIQSRLLRFNVNSLLVEMTMWDEAKSRVKALLWSTFIYVHIKSGRRTRHDEELMDLFNQLHLKDNQAESFEIRIRQIKNK